MKRKYLWILTVMTITGLTLTGCKEKTANATVADSSSLEINETTTATQADTTGVEVINGTFSIEGTSLTSNLATTLVNEYGNTAGNLINSGIVCEYEDKIYYYNKSDNKKLYVMNKDGSDSKAFGDIQGAMELNINGGYIYYQSGGIYKASVNDGVSSVLVESNCRNMVVTDNYIFYILSENEVSRIHRMNLDGTNDMTLSENIAGFLNVYGEYVYYINGSDSGKIYRMNLDGSEEMELSEDKGVLELLVEDNYIYYVSASSDGSKIYQMSKDGTDSNEISSCSCSNINVNSGSLYYFNATDKALAYRSGDLSEEKILYSGDLNAVNVISDWVYFFNTDDYLYYRISKDGNNIAIVE